MGEVLQTWSPDWLFLLPSVGDAEFAERNLLEGVKERILSSYRIAKLSVEMAVPSVVLVTTDRVDAVESVVEACWRLCEQILQAIAAEQQPQFSPVEMPATTVENRTRFAMVSSGALLTRESPLLSRLSRQVQSGGPVTLKTREESRYLRSAEDVAALVLQSAAIWKQESEAGTAERFSVDMGDPVSLYQLTKRVVEYRGLRLKDEKNPYGDIEVEWGEGDESAASPQSLRVEHEGKETVHPLIKRQEADAVMEWSELQAEINTLQIATESGDVEMVQALLERLVEGYHANGQSRDWVYQEQTASRK